MNIKINAIVLLLPFVIISGCDSDQKAPASKKAEAIQEEPAVAEVPAPMVDQAAAEKIAGNEVVEVDVEPVQQAALSGKQVYNQSCVNCHSTGVANAPKLGDAAAWTPRIAKGNDALYDSVKNGVPGTAMMPKGGCVACSDEELESVVDFMVSASK